MMKISIKELESLCGFNPKEEIEKAKDFDVHENGSEKNGWKFRFVGNFSQEDHEFFGCCEAVSPNGELYKIAGTEIAMNI